MFAHRHNLDGSWDSICLECFLNVIGYPQVRSEMDLSALEARHLCHISRLDRTTLLVTPIPPQGTSGPGTQAR